MTTHKATDLHTGKEIELELDLTPYEIMNTVYSFLTSVKTPELEFCKETHKEISEAYNLANIVLGDGEVPDTAREQFLASTFFSIGMKMGKVASWPIGEEAMKIVAKAKAPAVKGGNRSPKYDPYEKTILRVLAEYTSGENQLRSKADKLTSAKAIEKIEHEIDNDDGIESSVFYGWLKKYKENNGEFIFNGTKRKESNK